MHFPIQLHSLEERTKKWYSHVIVNYQPEKIDHECTIQEWNTSLLVNNSDKDQITWSDKRLEIRSNLQFNYNIVWDDNWNSSLHFVQRSGYDQYEDRSWEFSQRISLFPKLIEMDAFLLHAVCVVGENGKAIIFLGPSGAGKSTIAQKAIESGYIVITDDTALLKFNGNELEVYSSPYISRSGLLGKQGSWKVDSFVLLNKHNVNRVTLAKMSDFVKSFQERIFETQYLSHIFSFTSGDLGGDIAKRLLSCTRKITRQYKAYQLHFNLQIELHDVMNECSSGGD